MWERIYIHMIKYTYIFDHVLPFQTISDCYPNTKSGVKNWERSGKLNQHTYSKATQGNSRN